MTKKSQILTNQSFVSNNLCEFSVLRGKKKVNQQMKNMQNEPNLKNDKTNVTHFPTSNYCKVSRLQQPKNEPKTNPILNSGQGINQFMKKMQNEPNLLKTQMNLNPVKTKNYENKRLSRPRKNEPNTKPIQTNRQLLWPAVRSVLTKAQPRRRDLPTYSGQGLRKTGCPSRWLPAKTAYLLQPTPTLTCGEWTCRELVERIEPAKQKGATNRSTTALSYLRSFDQNSFIYLSPYRYPVYLIFGRFSPHKSYLIYLLLL